ncbi:MAG: hypothetical protein AAGF13_05525, partial [Pseudomonadota bacterium]
MHRDKTSLRFIQMVSLKGRTLDFWVDFRDGNAQRSTMIARADIASNMVLGCEIAQTENYDAAVHLIPETRRQYSIFVLLSTDIGSAVAGHVVAGGTVQKFRGKKFSGITPPPSVCQHRGLEIKFHQPGNPEAKLAERTFADLSRNFDDRPQFLRPRAGHSPGERPINDLVPVA